MSMDGLNMTTEVPVVEEQNNTVQEGQKSNEVQKVKYPCDQCGKQLYSPRNLRRHKQAVHENVRYPCDECDFIGLTLTGFQLHKKSKH